MFPLLWLPLPLTLTLYSFCENVAFPIPENHVVFVLSLAPSVEKRTDSVGRFLFGDVVSLEAIVIVVISIKRKTQATACLYNNRTVGWAKIRLKRVFRNVQVSGPQNIAWMLKFDVLFFWSQVRKSCKAYLYNLK